MTRDLIVGAGLGLAAFAAYMGVLDEVAPLLVLAGAVAAVAYLSGGRGLTAGLAVGPGRRPRTGVTFDDVGGQETAKRELREALDFIRAGSTAARMGIRPLRGILLAGPPGTGKTLLAKAAATYMGSAFLAASGSEFVEVYAGVGAQRVRSLFQRARRAAQEAPGRSAVIFIDEIEVLGGRRGRHVSHLEYDQTLNQLLVEMDGLESQGDERIVVIGATNRVDLLDEALLRPGRFDRVVRVDLPDRRGRREILALHLRGRPLAPDVDVDQLARETFGFSGAHLEAVVNEAAILAWREGDTLIRRRHFSEAVEKVLLGERADRRPTEEERRRVAYHEAAHALVGELVRPGSVASATIVPRGAALGFVRHRAHDDVWLWTREQLEAEAKIALAGYAAELLIFGSPSTGAADDLRRVHDIVERMVTGGMSPLGPVDVERAPVEQVQQVRMGLVQGLQDEVTRMLAAARPALEALVQALLEQETLSGEEVRAIIVQATGAGTPPPAGTAPDGSESAAV